MSLLEQKEWEQRFKARLVAKGIYPDYAQEWAESAYLDYNDDINNTPEHLAEFEMLPHDPLDNF